MFGLEPPFKMSYTSNGHVAPTNAYEPSEGGPDAPDVEDDRERNRSRFSNSNQSQTLNRKLASEAESEKMHSPNISNYSCNESKELSKIMGAANPDYMYSRGKPVFAGGTIASLSESKPANYSFSEGGPESRASFTAEEKDAFQTHGRRTINKELEDNFKASVEGGSVDNDDYSEGGDDDFRSYLKYANNVSGSEGGE
eukprot:GDKJ01024795.1.p1 GENE.GDKJ01024795.1~~GDKJ01024795.1.p1  ORF type:complete len:198 (-),score=38.79 GDKJ01024795.1:78-671(-)